jgi:tRNA pseudouridine38-40 synthase
MIKRYFIELSFKGTSFHGWQIQPNAITIQDKVNYALSVILKESISTVGAGRTDAGVHARNFTAHFDSSNYDPATKLRFLYGVNSVLPDEIAILNIYPVLQNAHARFDALSRIYEYRIRRQKNPFEKEYSFYYPHQLDINNLDKASEVLKQVNDFTSFSKLHSEVKTKVCRIKTAKWSENQGLLVFTIEADRFLRNMVRAIVGTLLEVGRGKILIEDFRKIILARDRSSAAFSVPAEGLFLLKVHYPETLRLK